MRLCVITEKRGDADAQEIGRSEVFFHTVQLYIYPMARVCICVSMGAVVCVCVRARGSAAFRFTEIFCIDDVLVVFVRTFRKS